MIWLVGVGCAAAGIVLGILIASRLNNGSSRIKELETQIARLREEHQEYRDSVGDHFSMSAELIQQLTESYREVYQHLAAGAQDLCSTEVASKLLPAESDAVFDTSGQDNGSELSPPRDYAAKQNPDQKGALAEDFGLDKRPATTPNAPTTAPDAPAEPMPEPVAGNAADAEAAAEPEPAPNPEPNLEPEPEAPAVTAEEQTTPAEPTSAAAETDASAENAAESAAATADEPNESAADAEEESASEPEPEPEPKEPEPKTKA